MGIFFHFRFRCPCHCIENLRRNDVIPGPNFMYSVYLWRSKLCYAIFLQPSSAADKRQLRVGLYTQGLSTYPSQLCVLSDHIESCLWMLEHEQRKSTLIFLTRLLLHTYTIALVEKKMKLTSSGRPLSNQLNNIFSSQEQGHRNGELENIL